MANSQLCSCKSGEYRRELRDARGIFCTFVCDVCVVKKGAEFRPEIFTDPDYATDEPIDEC
jgi:hypothetical protein